MEATTGQIFTLIPKIMAEVGAIAKTRKNPQQGYMFRGIDDVYLAIQGPLSKHGVFFVPQVLKQSREERQTKTGGLLIYTILEVQFTFYAPDGSNVVVVTPGEAMDSGDKSCNKAMSAALKIAALHVFCIPTEEAKDTENETHEPAAPAPTLPPAQPHIEKLYDFIGDAADSRKWGAGQSAVVAAIRGAVKKKYNLKEFDDATVDQCEETKNAINNGNFDKFATGKGKAE